MNFVSTTIVTKIDADTPKIVAKAMIVSETGVFGVAKMIQIALKKSIVKVASVLLSLETIVRIMYSVA